MLHSAPSCKIVIANFYAKGLGIPFSPPKELNQATARSIYNSWMNTSILDNYGGVWVSSNRLSEIFRTTKANSAYIQGHIREEHKRRGADGTYLRYSEVNKILNNIIQSAGSIRRENYAEYSESIGRSIRDSDKAKLLKHQFYESIKGIKSRLRSARIKKLKISQDELTSVPLLPQSNEFSHIRSCAVYPYTADNLWNGLIVNKDTHKIITENYINDEDELLGLCRERKWNTRWHPEFKAMLVGEEFSQN